MLIENLFGIASGGAAAGEDVVLSMTGVFSHAKVSAQAWAVGVPIYWDDSSKLMTASASGNTLIGVAAQTAATPSATGVVRLNGAVLVATVELTATTARSAATQAGTDAELANVTTAIRGDNGGRFTVSSGAITFNPKGAFWTLRDGDTATTEVELPLAAGGTRRFSVAVTGPGAHILIDAENTRFHYGGTNYDAYTASLVKEVGGAINLTDTSDYTGDAFVYIFEFELDENTQLDGDQSLGGFNDSVSERHWIYLEDTDDNQRTQVRAYYTPGSPAGFATFDSHHTQTSNQGITHQGRRRVALAFDGSNAPLFCLDNYPVRTTTAAPTAFTATPPANFTVGGQKWNNLLTWQSGFQVHLAAVLMGTYTAEDLQEVFNNSSIAHKLSMPCDSFGNLDVMPDEIRFLTAAAGEYVPLVVNGIGGTSLTQIVARVTDSVNAYSYDSTFVIVDGGLDTDGPDSIAALNSLQNTIGHTRWLWMVPHASTNKPLGSGLRDTEDATVNAVKAAFPSNFIDPLQYMLDGDPSDTDAATNGYYPAIYLSDTIHPNAAGYKRLGTFIYNELKARGWVS